MSDSDRPEPLADDSVVFDATPACTALVPMIQPAPWSPAFSQPLPRPDSPFVTHLIATAEQVPQTCSLRRATPADALTAYNASRFQAQGAGVRTQQII
jgi:hypothetical protein